MLASTSLLILYFLSPLTSTEKLVQVLGISVLTKPQVGEHYPQETPLPHLSLPTSLQSQSLLPKSTSVGQHLPTTPVSPATASTETVPNSPPPPVPPIRTPVSLPPRSTPTPYLPTTFQGTRHPNQAEQVRRRKHLPSLPRRPQVYPSFSIPTSLLALTREEKIITVPTSPFLEKISVLTSPT